MRAEPLGTMSGSLTEKQVLSQNSILSSASWITTMNGGEFVTEQSIN